nr:PREDICTED: uncharacterized protein LOC105677908 [Linepithema humile]
MLLASSLILFDRKVLVSYSVIRVQSLETDTMSLDIATKKHLWKYYVQLPNFEAQCKFCENKYNYGRYNNFKLHIARCHKKIWKYEEERKLIKWPWMYFKYSIELYSQCVICDANILSTSESIENHLNSHSEEQRENHILRNWPRKYWTQRSDFMVECNICHKNVPICIYKYLNSHTKMMHSNKIKNTQETHDTVDSSKCVSLFETDTMPTLNITSKEHVWKYYIKLSDFKAQCRFCTNKYSYVYNSHFRVHVVRHHRTIWKYEKERKSRPWMYFKYSNELYSQCVICDANVLSTSKSVENHLSVHSEQQQKKYIQYRNWSWKYFTKRSDFIVECNLCHNNVSLSFNFNLDSHIRSTHLKQLKNTQETHEAVGSSERVSPLETGTMFMSPKDL